MAAEKEAAEGLELGQIVSCEERGDGRFKYTTKGTAAGVDLPDGYHIIVSTADATKCFVLRYSQSVK